jgi:hypothetical protein
MPRSLLNPSVALVSVLALGCSDQPMPSESSTNIPPPSFRTVQNPEGPGAAVFRFNDLFFTVIVDFERGLTTVLGATPDEHLAACQSGLIPEQASFQQILRPGADSVVKLSIKGAEMGVTVWQATSFDICGELASVPFLAGGTARVRLEDNDAFGSRTRGNAFGVRAHGTVTSFTTGEELDLLVRYQALLLQTGEFRESSSEIILR